jgi:beta-N-acetylhexosaminidase
MLTDDISMKAITKYSKNTSAATLAILSGMDVILTSNNSQNYEEVLKDFKSGVINKEIVDNAVTRVLALKLFYLGDNIVNHKSNVLIIVLIIIGLLF